MKYLAALLFAVLLALASVPAPIWAQGGVPPTHPDGADTGAPGLFGHTPVPRGGAPAASTTAAGKSEPLTASMAKDEKGKNTTTTFAPTDTIYLLWKDPSAVKGDKVRVAWYAEDTGKAFPKNKKLSEFTQTLPGPGSFGSSIAPTVKGGLPVGKYRAEVYTNKTLVTSTKFTVVK